MAAISFPASLMTGLDLRWREQFQANRINTQTDSGPGKSRRRYTDAPRMLFLPFTWTESQVDTFDTFYHQTTAGGSLAFDFVHPRLNTTYECRFDGEPPQPVEEAAGMYRCSIALKTKGAAI